jgi:hypothetical protein
VRAAAKPLVPAIAACGFFSQLLSEGTSSVFSRWRPAGHHAEVLMDFFDVPPTGGIVLDADRYQHLDDSGSLDWSVVDDREARGGRTLAVLMDLATGDHPTGSRADFNLDIRKAGTYFLWVSARTDGGLAASDALHVALDGRALATGEDDARFGPRFRWGAFGSDHGALLSLTVETAGRHVLSLSPASGGIVLDSLYITSEADRTPGHQRAEAADHFVGSIGVNTHLGYADTSYNDFSLVQDSLKFLGIRHIRDMITDSPDQHARVDALGQEGYRFNFFIGGAGTGPLDYQLGEMAKRVGQIDSIEGPNESDTFPVPFKGVGFPDGTRMMMQSLRQALEADPVLGPAGRDIPVIQASLGKRESYAALGDLSEYAKFANSHSYYGNGAPPGSTIADRVREAHVLSPNQPLVATEGGYNTAGAINSGNLGLTDEVHGRYMTRFLLEQFAHGYERTFIYELLDERPDRTMADVEQHWGLFDHEGKPKLAARGISGLIQLLKDQGPDHPTFDLGFALKGLPASADSVLLQKRNGDFYLVLWNDAVNWNQPADHQILAEPVPISVQFSKAVGSVKVYEPLYGGTQVIALYGNTSGIRLDLPDHPVVLEIHP